MREICIIFLKKILGRFTCWVGIPNLGNSFDMFTNVHYYDEFLVSL